MRAAPILSVLLLLLLASIQSVFAATSTVDNNIKVSSEGGDSSVKVNVNNNVNTNNNTSSSNDTQTSTKVNIDQSGEGTSTVTVNGKEWKQEGPGSILVDETTLNSFTQTDEQSTSSSDLNEIVLEVEESQNRVEKIFDEIKEFILKIFSIF